MTDQHAVVSTMRFTLTTLSLLLIVWSVLIPVFVTSTPVALAASTDQTAEIQFDAFELLDNLALPANAICMARLSAVPSLCLTAVIEWAWSPTPPVRPPNSSNFI